MSRLAMYCLCIFLLPPVNLSWGATYWEETFDSWANWDHSAVNPAIAPCPSGFGTGSCYRGTYRGKDSGDYNDRYVTASSEVWVRFLYRLDAFTIDDTQTKIFYIASPNSATPYPNFIVAHAFGDRRISLQGQVVAEDCGTGGYDTCNYFPNVGSVPIQNGTEYCVEAHVRYNTPGAADGQIELYVNGTQTLNYTGRTFRGSSASGPGGNSSNAKIEFIREYVQHGQGTMWQDNLAVGTTRIGCGGSVPKSDTTAPASPTGLKAN